MGFIKGPPSQGATKIRFPSFPHDSCWKLIFEFKSKTSIKIPKTNSCGISWGRIWYGNGCYNHLCLTNITSQPNVFGYFWNHGILGWYMMLLQKRGFWSENIPMEFHAVLPIYPTSFVKISTQDACLEAAAWASQTRLKSKDCPRSRSTKNQSVDVDGVYNDYNDFKSILWNIVFKKKNLTKSWDTWAVPTPRTSAHTALLPGPCFNTGLAFPVNNDMISTTDVHPDKSSNPIL